MQLNAVIQPASHCGSAWCQKGELYSFVSWDHHSHRTWSDMAPWDVTIAIPTRKRWPWTCEFGGTLEIDPQNLWQGQLTPAFFAHNRETAESLCCGSTPEEWGKTHSLAHAVLCCLSFCKSGTRQCLALSVDSSRKAIMTSQEILGKQLNNSRCLPCLLYIKMSGFQSAAYLLK